MEFVCLSSIGFRIRISLVLLDGYQILKGPQIFYIERYNVWRLILIVQRKLNFPIYVASLILIKGIGSKCLLYSHLLNRLSLCHILYLNTSATCTLAYRRIV